MILCYVLILCKSSNPSTRSLDKPESFGLDKNTDENGGDSANPSKNRLNELLGDGLFRSL